MRKYHMNKVEKEINDAEVIGLILKMGKYAVVAMCRGEEPYVVTMNYG